MAETASSRWWEFYVVRYAMGTVVGAVVLYSLCSANATFRPLLFAPTPPAVNQASANAIVPISLERVQFALLATYGLVFCYIASAPVLVFHATRFMLDLHVSKRRWLKRALYYLPAPLLASVIIWVKMSDSSALDRLSASVVGFSFVFMVWLEYVAVALTLARQKDFYAFYRRLAHQRAAASEGDITDSYRHLREHGNSFFIVSLEILFGVILLGIGHHQFSWTQSALLPYLALFFIWTAPAVLVWVIATLFEREFADSAQKP